ncbi:MAG: hypothetical protein RIB59_15925 [Rhodospirillales bacterium]
MIKKTFVFAPVLFLAGALLAGCSDKVDVKMSGDEAKMQIVAPNGYDTLGVAEKHCRSYEKKAVYAGRTEGHGSIRTTHYHCMVR